MKKNPILISIYIFAAIFFWGNKAKAQNPADEMPPEEEAVDYYSENYEVYKPSDNSTYVIYEVDRSENKPSEALDNDTLQNKSEQKQKEENLKTADKDNKDAAKETSELSQKPKILFNNAKIVDPINSISNIRVKIDSRFIVRLPKESGKTWNYETDSDIVDLRNEEINDNVILLEYAAKKRGIDRLYFDLIGANSTDIISKIVNIRVD